MLTNVYYPDEYVRDGPRISPIKKGKYTKGSKNA